MIAAIAIVLFFILAYLIVLGSKRRFAALIKYTGGNFFWAGRLSFKYRENNFEICSIGNQNRTTGQGGSYQELLLLTPKPTIFFIGPEDSYKYISIARTPHSFQKVLVEGRKFIFNAKDSDTLLRIKMSIEQNPDIQKSVNLLLNRKFQYIQSISRLDIMNLWFKRKYFIRLSFMPHDILQNPIKLYPLIDQFVGILEEFKIDFRT